MKVIKIILLFVLVIPTLSFGQEKNIHSDELMSLPFEAKRKDVKIYPPIPGRSDILYRNYIPYNNHANIEVTINLVFLQKDNGQGNFQENDPEHQRFWDEVTAGISKTFSSFKNSERDSCFAWRDPFISDSKIRFKFNRFYMKNSIYWNWKLYGENAFGIDDTLTTLRDSMENNKNIPVGICVFFPENGDLFDEYMDVIISGDTSSAKDANFAYTSYPNKKSISRICMPDTYCKYLWMKHILPRNYAKKGETVIWENQVWYWEVNSLVVLISHELGHAFNLTHYNNHYGENYCRDALMAPSGEREYNHSYVPPTEIGKMYHALSEFLGKTVSSDIFPIGTMKVTNTMVWFYSWRCYTDVIITQSGSVEMWGNIQMPKSSKIEVSGQLYLIDANIKCVKEDRSWQGVHVLKGGLLWIENTEQVDFDIVMDSGSVLVLKGNVGFVNGHKMVLDKGVSVCVSSDFVRKGDAKPFYVNGTSSVLGRGIPSGINTKYQITCVNSGWQKFQLEHISLPETLYIQNQTLNKTETIVAKKIVVGNAVNPNTSVSHGNAVISSSGKVTFICKDKIVFDKGFRCEPDGEYKVIYFGK